MKFPENKIQRREHLFSCGINIRSAEDGGESRTIEGRAIVFNERSRVMYEDKDCVIREVIAPEAIPVDLLDSSDILMTLYHDNDRILARSKKGEGTLSYELDEKGVKFSFDAPKTEDGRVALELVRSGVIDGCSFAFVTNFGDPKCVSREVKKGDDGRREVTFVIRKIINVYDFTLTPRPAYPQTEVSKSMRDMDMAFDTQMEAEAKEVRSQIAELRRKAEMN